MSSLLFFVSSTILLDSRDTNAHMSLVVSAVFALVFIMTSKFFFFHVTSSIAFLLYLSEVYYS